MRSRHRIGPVQFRQQLARDAMFRGGLDAARSALSTLQAEDFAGGPAVSQRFLTVLRKSGATEEELRAAIDALLHLRPAAGR